MGLFYQKRDHQLFEYELEELHGEWFRGPLDRGSDSIAWLGAAQTFGRLVTEPFPRMVGQGFDLGTLNLGSGGKGPEFYLRNPDLIEEVNRCRVAVVQVMSAKSSDNSLYRSRNGGGFGHRADTGEAVKSALPIIEELRAHGRRREARRIVVESQRAYLDSMQKLLKALKLPKILFWFSVRHPPSSMLGVLRSVRWESPQMVNRAMLSQMSPLADRFISVVSSAGLPQVLRDDAGDIFKTNKYYPSPEMHRIAADRLAPVVSELIR
jgi:Domain of unknown function (DUF6473)